MNNYLARDIYASVRHMEVVLLQISYYLKDIRDSKACSCAALLDKGHKMRTECGPKEIDDGTERS